MDFEHTLIKPKLSSINSRKDVNLIVEYKDINFKGIPIIASNMDSVGTIDMAKILSKYELSTALHKFIDVKDYNNLDKDVLPYTFFTVGMKEESNLDLLDKPHMICLDVANGYTIAFREFVKRTRDKFPKATIMAGNVASFDGASELFACGADIVKAGIGPGEMCTTRKMTGVGINQIDAIKECAYASSLAGKYICSDGGCRNVGDIAKAFCAGADFVMVGTMFSGHDENSKIENGLVKVRGMSSEEAMVERYGKIEDYRTSEGDVKYIPFRGSVHETVKKILGGLRSACTYTDSKNLMDLKKAELIYLK